MYIMKRPSSGRGELELAERLGPYGPHDMKDLPIEVDCDAYGVFPTHIEPQEDASQGKVRLRRCAGFASLIHIHRQVLALLMMPSSIREESRLSGGEPVIWKNRYLVKRIDFTTLVVNASSALVSLGTIDLWNGSNNAQVEFPQRLQRVSKLHHRAVEFQPDIQVLIQAHEQLLMTKAPLTQKSEQIIEDLMRLVAGVAPDYDIVYTDGTDVLPALESMLVSDEADQPEPVPIEQIPDEEIELRRREITKWQRVASRGSQGATFRTKVQTAYRQTCVVCGLRFPKGPHCAVPGVDAAHIMPWHKYEWDDITNGLCLCRLHHWAFDQRLIAIRYDSTGTVCNVSVTETAALALSDAPASLAALRAFEGPITADRLPANEADWPDPQMLEQWYEAVRPDI